MDHDYIKQSDLVDHYVIGKLTTQESEQFEEHFIDCPLCIDQLKIARDFRQGLQLLTLQQTMQVRSEKPKLSGAFLRKDSWKTAALAACFLLLAACSGLLLLVNYSNHLRSEAEQAKSVALDWQRQSEEQQQSSLSVDEQHQKTEQLLKEQLLELKTQLQDEQNRNTNKPETAENSMQVEVNPQIVDLESNRAADSGTNVIRLSRSSIRFFISISLEGEAEYKTYRLRIMKGSRILWSQSGVTPYENKALRLSLGSQTLPTGNYNLIVEGITGPENFSIVGNYSFRVVKSP